MKKTLLPASGNLFLNNMQRFSLKIAFALMLFIASLPNANAQCIGPYLHVESIPPMSGTTWKTQMQSGANPWAFGGTGSFVRSTTPANAHSGASSLVSSSNNFNPSVTTLKIGSIQTFSFYIKRAGPLLTTYQVEVSNDGVTWNTLVSGTNALYTTTITATLPSITSGGWEKVVVTGAFPIIASPGGYQFRVTDDRVIGTNGSIFLDDFAWTSPVANENLTILNLTSASTTCTVPFVIQDGLQYTLYDSGANDTYHNNQTAAMTNLILTPANAASKIKIEFEEFNTVNSGCYLQVFNSNNHTSQVGGNLFGGGLPGNITSSAGDGSLSFSFISSAANPAVANIGYKIKVTAVQCSIPNTLAGLGTAEQANLTWVGTPSATEYEVYQSTSALPVPVFGSVGTLTGSTTPSYNYGGLTAGTTYYFWVRSICSSDKSGWTGPVAVVPLCAPVSVPYLENFNGYVGGVLPTCTSADDISWATNSVNGNLFTNAPYTSFFTQGVSLTAGQLYRVTYDFSTNLIGTADLEVLVGTTPYAPTQGTISTGLASHSGFSNIQSNIVNFTAATTSTYYLNFNLSDLSIPPPGGGAMNLDNIKIEVETCLPPTFDNYSPTAPAVSAPAYATVLSDFSATINWNVPITGVPTNGYLYYVSTSPTPPIYLATPTGSAPSNTVTLTGLSPNTRYYVWARADCAGQISTWSVHYATFVTTNLSAPVLIKIDDVEVFPAVGAALAYNSGCNFNFTDTGGAAGNYVNYENNITYTFRPQTSPAPPANTKLVVVFNSFSTENNWDGLMIYSGDDSAGNTRQLMSSGRIAGFNPATCPAGAYSGTASPGTIISNAANGSLSFTFSSDYLITGVGWTATIKCIVVPTITSFSPASNACGTTNTVTINGTNFTGTTGVFFGSVAASSFSINGAGTVITAIAPAVSGVSSAPIRVVKSDVFVSSLTNFTLQPPPPVTTAATICVGGSGALTSSTVCSGFTNAVTTIPVTIAATPTADRPLSSGNSTVCNFSAGNLRSYNATDFQVSVTGSYIFTTSGGTDLMGYITRTPFTAGTCSSNFVIGDDDGGAGLNPQMTVTLTAGVTYTLYTTTWLTGITGSFTWTVTPPIGGNVLLFQNSQVGWYTAATGGAPIFSGASFNPVGFAGSGIVDNLTPITKTFYAACSTNSTCRTPTIFTINNPGAITPATQTIGCTGSVAPLVLASNTSPVIKWQYNATDPTFATGVTVDIVGSAGLTTLTTALIGTFAGTRNYRAETNGVCLAYSNVASITFDRAVWNGAWTGTPSATAAVEFQANYSSTGNLDACSVTVTGGNVVFNTGHTLTVQNAVTVTGGTLTFEDGSSLYQPNAVANAVGVYSGGNSGNITYNRTSTPMFKSDYSYWSAPVYPQNLLAMSPSSPANYFLEYTGTAWSFVTPSATTMTPAKGYLVRAPWFFQDYIPSPPSTRTAYTAPFTGVPNNGAISIPVIGGSGQLNLIGNPYPSAISAFPTAPAFPATGFLTANTNLKGSIYFWTHNTPLGVFAWGQYDPNDYAIYNLTGGSTPATGVGTLNTTVPNGIIGSGQGFFIEGLSAAPSNANFTNAMRRPTGNTAFFRTSEPNQAVENGVEKHRYWLDITNNNNDFKQVLIGYIEGATNGLDRLYDAKMVDIDSKVTIYTKVEDTHLTIQGKDLAFDINEQIPLYFYTKAADTYTINLSNFDGLFLNQNIYLEDTMLNVIHDLKDSPYTFASDLGLFENRFKVRYTTGALGVNDAVFNENSVVVYHNEQGLFVNSGAVTMKNVTIYDIAGRLITAKTKVNDVTTVFTTLPKTQQVLLVKIESIDGAIVTKKIVF